MSNIFISYRHEGDPELVERLANKLTTDGYKVFMDKDSLRRGKFDEKILKSIEKCKDFIVILDKQFFDRTLSGIPIENDWARRELAYAIKLKKNIIPVMLDGFKWPELLPADIAEVKLINGIPYSSDYYDHSFYHRLQEYMKTPRPLKTYFGKIVLGLVVLSLVGLALYVVSQTQKIAFESDIQKQKLAFDSISQKLKEPTLVLMGGGSVKNFIRDTAKFDLSEYNPKNYKYIYVPTPSKLAWPQIAEVRSINRTKYKDVNDYPYHLILLSAGQATENDLIPDSTERHYFRDHWGYIEEVYLGKSNLRVAILDRKNLINLDSTITIRELKELLTLQDVSVYTTKKYSGTYHLYDSLLKTKGCYLKNINNINEFREDQSPTFTENTDLAIFLGSSTYLVNINGTKQYDVYDEENHRLISNKLYLYFIIFKQNDHAMIIPDVVRGFLENIGFKMPENDKLESELGSLIHRQLVHKNH